MADTTNENCRLLDKVHALEIEMARLQEQKGAADKALDLARQALERSQNASNEWRQENIDQRVLFMSKNEATGLLGTEAAERRALEARVSALEKIDSVHTGSHATVESVWVKGIAVLGFVLALVGLLMHLYGK